MASLPAAEPGPAALAAPVWQPTDATSFAPAGPRSKAAANIAALEVLAVVRGEHRPATGEEQAVLARWSSWGALPKLFDDADTEWTPTRARVRSLLSDEEWSAARRTTLNAHYTDPSVVAAVWEFLAAVGFDGGPVLEPGCGSFRSL